MIEVAGAAWTLMQSRRIGGVEYRLTRRSQRFAPPTRTMVAFAERLARDKRAKLPIGYDQDLEICGRFLDRHVGRA